MLDSNGLSHLWERIKGYVSSYIEEYDRLAVATPYEKGQVRPDGVTVTVDDDGTLHSLGETPIATTAVAGKVKPDGSTITVDDDGTIHGISSSGVVQETDPTVPAWAKRSKKPEYTPDEVGAVASTDIGIPNGVAGLDDDGLVPLSQLPPLTNSVATNESIGVVKPDGITTIVDDYGKLSVAKKTSTVVATGGDVRKGDFSYIVLRVDTYYTNYQIRNIRNLYLDLAINDFHSIVNFDINGRNCMIDKLAIIIYSNGTVCLSTYGILAGKWFYSRDTLITLGTFDALSIANDNNMVRVTSARLDYGTYYNGRYSNSTTLTLFSFISERYIAGIPVDNDTIKLNEHGIMQTNIRVSSPLTYTNGVIYLPFDNSLSNIVGGALSVNIPYIFERLNVYSSELITFTEDGESPTIDIRTATPESPGIVRPDNKTTFMDGDKITVKSYDDTIDDLQRKVGALMRRVKALEDELGLDTMTYDNGTLYVNSTYEDGTLVTNRTYEDGTLL